MERQRTVRQLPTMQDCRSDHRAVMGNRGYCSPPSPTSAVESSSGTLMITRPRVAGCGSEIGTRPFGISSTCPQPLVTGQNARGSWVRFRIDSSLHSAHPNLNLEANVTKVQVFLSQSSFNSMYSRNPQYDDPNQRDGGQWSKGQTEYRQLAVVSEVIRKGLAAHQPQLSLDFRWSRRLKPRAAADSLLPIPCHPAWSEDRSAFTWRQWRFRD